MALCIFTVSAQAGSLTLTAAGVSHGFTLSTFVDGYNFGGNYGPISQGVAANGKIITGSVGDQKVYVFNDVDNQHLSDATASSAYTCQTGNCNFAMATVGSEVYGGQALGGKYEHFAVDGTFTDVTGPVASLLSNLGMWGNPANGHLISASTSGLIDIDPSTGNVRIVNQNLFPDGVSVTPDGTTVFVENGGAIQSYNLADGSLIHTYSVGHGPDGTGVIYGGAYNGDVVVNNNDGTVGLLDPTKADGDPDQFVIIASGGSRGDFTSPDYSNGTLFLNEQFEVDRLSCGNGCTIGSATPEPVSLALAGGGLLLLGLIARRRRS
jgi:hypothetical protein